ncbi:hypothetical protein [Martelella limonii]|uniref:hypothetical protein n=1 Tax=Martelella limonii TaxID=1647649 RepID=UPI0015807329|nr:hypothetical protein [Martelella limonii]
MIFGFSPHTGSTIDSEVLRAIIYYLQKMVRKNLEGKRVTIRRDPAPELLLGQADPMRDLVRSLRNKHRYSAMTMSFLADDIPVPAFNAGDRVLRDQVGKALRLFNEVAYAGVPRAARFQPLVGTHTHTGRLEVNILMPRAVCASNGKLLSYNPHPPREGSRQLWDAFRDTLNGRFGWSDPLEYERRRKVILADWILKQRSEAWRNLVFGKGLQSSEVATLAEYQGEGGARNRDTIFANIAAELDGLEVISFDPQSVTIYDPIADRPITISGYWMSKDFDDGKPFLGMSEDAYRAERAAKLERAPRQLLEGMQKRAEMNAERYGYPPEPVPDPEDILAGPGLPLPSCHPEFLPGARHGKNTEPNGTRIGRVPEATRAGAGIADIGAGGRGQRAEGGFEGTDGLADENDAVTPVPQPDFDPRKFLAGLKNHLGMMADRLRHNQATVLLLGELERVGLERFKRIAKTLEMINERTKRASQKRSRNAESPDDDLIFGGATAANDRADGKAEGRRPADGVHASRGSDRRSTGGVQQDGRKRDGTPRSGPGNWLGRQAPARRTEEAERQRGEDPRSTGSTLGGTTAELSRADLIRRVLSLKDRTNIHPRISFVHHEGREWLRFDTEDGHVLYDGETLMDFDTDGMPLSLRSEPEPDSFDNDNEIDDDNDIDDGPGF